MTRFLPTNTRFPVLGYGAWLVAPLTWAIACGTENPAPSTPDSTGGEHFVPTGGFVSVGAASGAPGEEGATGGLTVLPATGGEGAAPGGGTATGGEWAGGVPPTTGGAVSGGTPPLTGGTAASGGSTAGGVDARGNGGATSGTTTGGAGTGGVEPTLHGDDFVSDISVEVHPDINTILVVTWTQTMASEQTWLEFSFAGEEAMTSRPTAGTLGDHEDVVLGVPGETDVTVRVVNAQGGVEYSSSDQFGTTDAVPSGMPEPTLLHYDPELASPDRFLFGAVEDSEGDCDDGSCYYFELFWVYIMDRQGRIVWYYADPASNATSSFQRVARDGEYIWIEKRPFGGFGSRGVLKMTLDHSYYEEIPVQGLSDCIDVTDDGSLLYDVTGEQPELREMTRDGQVRTIWSCRSHFGNSFDCYSNTVNWNPLADTVVLSFPYEKTVIEIDRQSGEVIGQYGAAPGSYAFSPSSWGFEFQHFANVTVDGTLLVSSHMPGYEITENPVAGQHAFMEFDIDRERQVLTERWIYNEGQEWAAYKGMAIRLPNGNTLANYGTGGVIREITPDKQTAFDVKFDRTSGDDFFNKMVGSNVLIDDLYSLNGGGPQ